MHGRHNTRKRDKKRKTLGGRTGHPVAPAQTCGPKELPSVNTHGRESKSLRIQCTKTDETRQAATGERRGGNSRTSTDTQQVRKRHGVTRHCRRLCRFHSVPHSTEVYKLHRTSQTAQNPATDTAESCHTHTIPSLPAAAVRHHLPAHAGTNFWPLFHGFTHTVRQNTPRVEKRRH